MYSRFSVRGHRINSLKPNLFSKSTANKSRSKIIDRWIHTGLLTWSYPSKTKQNKKPHGPQSAKQLARRTLAEEGFWGLEQDISNRTDVRDKELPQVLYLNFSNKSHKWREILSHFLPQRTGQARMLIKLQISCRLAADSFVGFQATPDI